MPDSDGVLCLANDNVLEGLVALCHSLAEHAPQRHLTVIPFDEKVNETRALLDEFGFALYDDPSLREMDLLGQRYWPGNPTKAHNMRKFCGFWGPYEHFLFLDSDIVLMQSPEPYLEAIRTGPHDFLWFWDDISNVYKPGPLRERMIHEYGTQGFNAGAFLGRRGALTPGDLERAITEAEPVRADFVDNLEQTFMNFAVDIKGLSVGDANDAVPEFAAAAALMRVKRVGGRYVMADHRVQKTDGRTVSLMHWAGYSFGPYMPYRRLFLHYRLRGQTQRQVLEFQARQMWSMVWNASLRGAANTVYRRWRYFAQNALAARGLIGWGETTQAVDE